jgi:hypothetical protein
MRSDSKADTADTERCKVEVVLDGGVRWRSEGSRLLVRGGTSSTALECGACSK